MNIVTCGTCGLSWDDDIETRYTPAPSARCPFEYFHRRWRFLRPRDIPADFPVHPVAVPSSFGSITP